MRIRWGRLLVGTAIAELVPIATLIVMVAAMGPRDPEEADSLARTLGRWVGPWVGAAMAFVMARWVSRPLLAGHAVHRWLLGLFLALFDVVLLMAAAEPFAWVFVASNIAKVAAATIGGMVMTPRAARAR